MSPSIVGWSHTPFGRLDGRDIESLVVEVARNALDAIEAKRARTSILEPLHGGTA